MTSADLAVLDATPVRVGGNSPFLLEGDEAWIVARGRVDVCCVPRAKDGALGARMHLFRVETGRLLLAGPASRDAATVGLLAVGASGTELLRISTRRLWQAAAGKLGEASLDVSALLDEWVCRLYEGMAPAVPPPRVVPLEAGRDAALQNGECAQPLRGVVWVSHTQGSSRLLGRSSARIEEGALVPIAAPGWLEAEDASRVVCSGVRAAQGRSGLDLLQALLVEVAAERIVDAERSQQRRLERRVVDAQVAYATGWARFAEVMHGRSGDGTALLAQPPGKEDALLAASEAVGKALGIAIRAPTAAGAVLHARDPVGAIARASGVRVRQVSLRDEWWRQDGGPFLGWRLEDSRPVALLPDGPRRYVCHDPVTRETSGVTAAVAQRLSLRAYTFYRSFGTQPLTLRGVLAFGVQRCRRDILMIGLMSLAVALLSLITPIATGVVFRQMIPSAERAQLVQLVALLLIVTVVSTALSIASSIALLRVEARFGGDLMAAVWDRLVALPARFFRGYSAGNLATRAMAVDAIRQILSVATMSALLTGTMSVFQFAFLFHVSPRLAALSALLVGLMVSVTAVGSYYQLGRQRAIAGLQAKLTGIVLQLLTNIGKLRVAGAEPRAFALWAQQFAQQRRLQFQARAMGNGLRAFHACFPVIANIALFAAALPVVTSGRGLQTGDFIAFLTAFGTVMSGMLTISGMAVTVLTVIPYHDQLRPLMSESPERGTGQADPGVLRGDIELQHVAFRYDAKGPPVLRDLTLRARAGQFVAIVGPSGAGKSTVLRMLLGFEQPENGAIYFDGQDLGKLDLGAVRGQIGVVLQHAQPLPGDVFGNIVGSSRASVSDAWEAARMAGFEEDLKSMPMGMHTVIGEGLSTLSGGQRQRMMIARALVRRPRILLLDEATSALDNRTQAAVSACLERLKVTRVVIAHRLSTVMHADRIFVVENGEVAEAGSYAELMEHDGPFAQLAKRQLA